jgi:hypothetical protein
MLKRGRWFDAATAARAVASLVGLLVWPLLAVWASRPPVRRNTATIGNGVILRAIRERHIYGSTDNIVAEFTSKADGRDYVLGDEFTTFQPPNFRIKIVGTAPLAKLTLGKDDVEIELACAEKRIAELT